MITYVLLPMHQSYPVIDFHNYLCAFTDASIVPCNRGRETKQSRRKRRSGVWGEEVEGTGRPSSFKWGSSARFTFYLKASLKKRMLDARIKEAGAQKRSEWKRKYYATEKMCMRYGWENAFGETKVIKKRFASLFAATRCKCTREKRRHADRQC